MNIYKKKKYLASNKVKFQLLLSDNKLPGALTVVVNQTSIVKEDSWDPK